MSKFTKGPWLINLNCYNLVEGYLDEYPSIVNSEDFTVCQICDLDIDESLADAHLIAAAPEMYEALNNIINDCSGFMDEYLEPAIEALAKARGES